MNPLFTLNSKLTVQKITANGLICWENPTLAVVLVEDGQILNKESLKPVAGSVQATSNAAPVKSVKTSVYVDNKRQQTASTFNSLFLRVVLGFVNGDKSTKGLKVVRKDLSKGFVEGNVAIQSPVKNEVIAENFIFPPSVEEPIQTSLELQETGVEESSDMVKEKEKLYTIVKGTQAFCTEDNAVFHTLELANWHQDVVSKGKGNAQVVLDYNGGWQLAEAIFHQDVKYNKKRPYENFRDVMENNEGVKDISEEDKASFKNLEVYFKEQGLDGRYIDTWLYKRKYSLEVAEELQEKLEAYIAQAKLYKEALRNIKAATKALNESVCK